MPTVPRITIALNPEGRVVAAMPSLPQDDGLSIGLDAPADHVVAEADLPPELHEHDEHERLRRVLGYRRLGETSPLKAD